MPTGQVFDDTRIMTQPMTTSGAVAKPNSSAPRRRQSPHRGRFHLAVDLNDDAIAEPIEQSTCCLPRARAPGARRRA